jgi:hypothetical protein
VRERDIQRTEPIDDELPHIAEGVPEPVSA